MEGNDIRERWSRWLSRSRVSLTLNAGCRLQGFKVWPWVPAFAGTNGGALTLTSTSGAQ
jgi:hypothetical protein